MARAIDAARKYVDAGRVGRGRAPRGPESKHSEMRCKAIAGRSGSAPYQRRQINIFHCRSNKSPWFVSYGDCMLIV